MKTICSIESEEEQRQKEALTGAGHVVNFFHIVHIDSLLIVTFTHYKFCPLIFIRLLHFFTALHVDSEF